MNKTLLVVLIIAFSFLGIADSWYLAKSALGDTALTCTIDGLDGCNIVAQSPYSKLFGVPLGVYGVGFYALIFTLAALLLVVSNRRAYQALFMVAAFGAIASILFLFMQIVVIKALCIYCIVSAALAFLTCATAWVLFRRHMPPYLATVL